jgi:hypothetical protein
MGWHCPTNQGEPNVKPNTKTPALPCLTEQKLIAKELRQIVAGIEWRVGVSKWAILLAHAADVKNSFKF